MNDYPTIPEPFDTFTNLIDVRVSPEDDTISYTVELVGVFTAQQRGKILLDLEDKLCETNAKFRVWHVALGDKNSLRNLRGISVTKS